MKRLLLPLLVCVIAISNTELCHAAHFKNSTGLENPTNLVTMNESPIPHGAIVTDQLEPEGITISPFLYFHEADVTTTNSDRNFIFNFGGPRPWINPFSIHFTEVVSEAAFLLATRPVPNTTFTALLNGEEVERFTESSRSWPASYYGFTGIEFNEIHVSIGGGVTTDDGVGIIDNIQFSPIIDPDSDGDGIPDSQDDCPHSELEPTVRVQSIISDIPNLFFEDGCTITDVIQSLIDSSENKDEFMDEFNAFANSLKRAGLISGKQKGQLTKIAAKVRF